MKEYEVTFKYGKSEKKVLIVAESKKDAEHKARLMRKGFASAERALSHRDSFFGDCSDELV